MCSVWQATKRCTRITRGGLTEVLHIIWEQQQVQAQRAAVFYYTMPQETQERSVAAMAWLHFAAGQPDGAVRGCIQLGHFPHLSSCSSPKP
jgi:hypothetical protein